ncbi:SOS response-associated peptidase [Granulosicoccus sp.]|nr:SOS response-associated peptidase [Granulosicoccus sp.]MDB4224185.1 SOS response-associated peptidase [Granulosicoccus sp.]
MCGRVNVSDNEGVRVLLESMGMDTWPARDPRYNIAPTQTLDVVKLDGDLTLEAMSWGVSMMLPGKNGMVTKRIQNSRDDKVWSSRLWKPLIENQRVLVPVNGFYEWKRVNKKIVAAFYITPSNSSAMFFAGIYKTPKDELQKSEVSVITTSANDAMSEVHDRMPVILTSQNAAMAWLQEGDKASLTELMTSASNETLKFTEVSNFVNKSSNEGPECIEAKVA